MKDLISGLVASMVVYFANPLDSYSQYYEDDSKGMAKIILSENNLHENTVEENINFVMDYMNKTEKDSIGSEGFSFVRNKNSYDFYYEVPFDSGIVDFRIKDSGSGPGYDGLGSSTLFQKDTVFYGSKNEFFVLDGLSKKYEGLHKLIWNDAADLVFKEKVKEFNPKFAESFDSQE